MSVLLLGEHPGDGCKPTRHAHDVVDGPDGEVPGDLATLEWFVDDGDAEFGGWG